MKKPPVLPLIAALLAGIAPMPLYSRTASKGQESKPDAEHPTSSVPGETKEQRDARMEWWRKARFGMFIHWGVYAVPAGYYQGNPVKGLSEWVMYQGKIPVNEYKAFAKNFDPVEFDAAKLVAAAKSTGMKYIIVTTKHHDGFAMFDSKASDWNIVKASPYGKDPIRALAEECRKQGVRLGFYYSHAQDWNNGGAIGLSMPRDPSNDSGAWDKEQLGLLDDYIEKVALPQVKELLTEYGPDTPAVLWWDTPKSITKERAAKFAGLVANLRPGLIQNDRLSNAKSEDDKKFYPGDTQTPEQYVPPEGYPGLDWESCMTVNDSWGFKRDDQHWKSAKELITNLVDIASKGGNYLLNVGPDAKGNIPSGCLKELSGVGDWMKNNGEAIYGTTGTPFGAEFGKPVEGKDGYGFKKMLSSLHEWRATKKPGHLYIFVFEWPKNGSLRIPAYDHTITAASLLADPSAKLTVKQNGKGITVKGLPSKSSDPIASVIDLKY